MVIKLADLEPEGDRSKKADAPPGKREPDAEALKDSIDPELPHTRPEPKKRKRN